MNKLKECDGMEEKRIGIIEAFEISIKEAPDLWKEWERLWGVKLFNRAPIEVMIDQETGHDKQLRNKAFEFFIEYIWMRLPDESFTPSQVR